MTEVDVRQLSETEWETYKSVRLRGLQESPDAFAADYATEAGYEDQVWKDRMSRSRRLVAQQNDKVVGVVSVRSNEEMFENAAELFGLWVDPELRGAGIASKLVLAVSDAAARAGHTQLIYWVSTDNGRGVAFASSYGFRPSEYRRPMRAKGAGDGEEELAMVLALRS